MREGDNKDLMEEFKKIMDENKQWKETTCPYCGRCPHCGRPYNDWVHPLPYWQPGYVWCQTTDGTDTKIS